MDYTALYEILACTAVASFHLVVGACLSYSAILIPQLEAPDSDIKVTKDETSWIASVITLVMPLGAVIAGSLADKIGRLNTLRLTALPHTLGWICIAQAQDFHAIMLGRVLTGFAYALALNPGLVYITEVSRSEFRGSLMCLAPSVTSMAMVIVYTQGAYLHWRTVAWLSLVYCVLPMLLISLWAPESPLWLVSKGKTDRALQSFQYFFRKDENASLAEQRLSELVSDHNKRAGANRNRSNLRIMMRNLYQPTCWKPMTLLTMIFVFQQTSGIYVTMFYTVSFFEDNGASIDPFICTIGIGLVRLVMGIITMFLMKRFGRRPLFVFSGIGMAIFLSISGYINKQISEGNMEKNFVPIVCILLYMTVGVVGFMSIPWTMTAEVFPTEIRGIAQGMMIAIANIITFAVLKVYPFMGDVLGGSYAVQWFFCSMSVLGTLFIYVFVPETHRKKLKEIEEYFTHHCIYILSKNKQTGKGGDESGEEAVELKDKA